VANLLAHQPVPAGRRVVILTNAMGPAIMAADACEANGLELPALSDGTVAELRSFLPEAARVINPVDMLPTAPPEHYRRAMRALLADEGVDSLIVIYIPPLFTDAAAVAAAIVEAAGANSKPVLANFMSAEGAPDILAKIPSYTFPEAAAAALGKVTAYGEWRRRPIGTVPVFEDIRAEDARRVVERALERGGGWLEPDEVRELLSAAGIPMARFQMVSSADAAVAAASEIRYPVALKAMGPNLLRKQERGAVAVNLADEVGLRGAYAYLQAKLGGEMTSALVQEVVTGGVEVIVGTTLDPTFGPLVAYGSGGRLVELMADVAFRINPLTDADVADMMEEVKGTALLRGYRGAPPADEAALREIILRVSALLEICPQIHEMDANPIQVLEKGAIVVDARVRVDREFKPILTRRIAY
ncbi:MAG TPA: acetate--CoA ligase family protein, partial [Blastocatellia bacterium]|nr:acetate--CoA ligase family protein [Blastocatellia bacterium]